MSTFPCFDLPTEKLYDYSGTNPKPHDFDDFWQETLEQTDALAPDIDVEPVTLPLPGVRCAHLTFTGLGGARVYAKFLRPESLHPNGNPGLLNFHGYSVQSAEWLQLYRFASLGFFVLALDCRGQAGRSEESGGTRFNTLRGQIVRGVYEDPRELRFRYIFSDAYRLATILAGFPEVDAAHLASRITARCLMGTGLADTVCPPSTQFAAYNRIQGPKKVRFYPLYAHELLPGLEDEALQEWAPLLPKP